VGKFREGAGIDEGELETESSWPLRRLCPIVLDKRNPLVYSPTEEILIRTPIGKLTRSFCFDAKRLKGG